MEELISKTDDGIFVKKYSLISDNLNKYQIYFLIRKNNLYIKAQEEISTIKKKYEKIISLEAIKQNPYFYSYNSINEILDVIFPLIDNGKSELKGDFNSLILIINLPTLNVREISFKLEKNENFKNNELNELYKYIIDLHKENV